VSTLRTTRSATVIAAVLVAVAPLISACGAGQNAPTKREFSVADGVQTHAGNVVLRNVLLTADVAVGTSSKALALQGVIDNNTGGNDSLVGVTANNVPFNSTTSAASVVPGTPVALGTGGLGLTVANLPTGVLPGSLVSVTFSFQQSGQVTVAVPVYTLSSRTRGSEPTSAVTFPTPDLPDGYNEKDFDNKPAS
jgi:hypothetical protein